MEISSTLLSTNMCIFIFTNHYIYKLIFSLSVPHITEQYSLRPKRLFANVDSIRAESCDSLLGVEGLDEDLDDGLDAFVADLFAGVLLDFADPVGFLLTGVGLTGDLKSGSVTTVVKLSSLIGDTEDLLLMAVEFDFLADCDVDFVAGFRDLLADDVAFFFIEAGVVLAFEDLGLGVPLMGFEALLAGVAVCLAILIVVS